MMRPYSRRKPARAFPATADRTTIRVSKETAEAVQQIRGVLIEWMLSHADPDVRSRALMLSTDQAVRIVLSSFARDYAIRLQLPRPAKES